MLRIALGSKQYIIVDVTDRLSEVVDLAPLNPVYSVYNAADAIMISNAVPDVDGMELHCLVDTTTPGPGPTVWTTGRYLLYAMFVSGPETPRLGPVRFKITP